MKSTQYKNQPSFKSFCNYVKEVVMLRGYPSSSAILSSKHHSNPAQENNKGIYTSMTKRYHDAFAVGVKYKILKTGKVKVKHVFDAILKF